MVTKNSQGRRVMRASAWIAAALAAIGLHGAAVAGGADVDGEIVVQLRTRSEIAPLLVKHQLSLIGRFGTRPIYRLKVIGDAKVKDKIDALRSEWDVRSAEPNVKHAAPEPHKNLPWAIGDPDAYSAQWAGQAIRLAEGQRLSTGAGVRIALLDTGVDASHPALAGKLLPGFDFVDFDNDPAEAGSAANPSFGHGTHVAGLLALVAPDARILPLRILDADGIGNAWVLAEAMLHAVDPDGDPSTNDGAQVINLSIGTLTKTNLFKTVAKLVTCKEGSWASVGDLDEDDDDSKAASPADKARCAGFGGAVVVAAAGNRGDDKAREYPAGEESKGLLSVAASDSGGWLAAFSNYGWVKIAAPGEGITSSVPGGGYATWSGTSMAAPLTAGAAALLRAAEPRLKVEQVVKRLQDRGARLCGTNVRQLDVAAVLGDEPQRSRPRCDEPRR
jgi:subtilisin family serine protease